MLIKQIRLKNFKTFKDVTIKDIPPYCVFVGANGTGKSTLFSAFTFLKNAMTYNVNKAMERLGGVEEVRTRGEEGCIEIELKIDMPLAHDKPRIVTYALHINERNGLAYIEKEALSYRKGESGRPYKFLEFKDGKGEAINNEERIFDLEEAEITREQQTLSSPDILAVKGLGQFERFKAAKMLRELIEHWHVSDFHIGEARGSKDAMGQDEHLSDTGDNLQRVAYRLFTYERRTFDRIIEKMRARVPGVTKVIPIKTEDKRILLKFIDETAGPAAASGFIDQYVSDGTLKMFAYLTLLHEPKPHAILCVEEPENQLYPSLLQHLAEEFKEYTTARRRSELDKQGQVFVSTHSPDFLDAVDLESVFWLVKKDGCTIVHRANEDQQLAAYMAQGDKMGRLWGQGLFQDADPR